MIFQQGGNSYDITLICMSVIGLVLLISYVVFSYLVTHRGDFYHVRRWKAAIWCGGAFGLIGSILLIILLVTSTDSKAVEKSTCEVVEQVIGWIVFNLILFIPFLFMVTIGMYYQLTRWLNSDDYLDKIWKDP